MSKGKQGTQLIFTCSKSTVKTGEERYEIYSRLIIKTLNDVCDVILVPLLLTLNIFHTFVYCFCYFEHVIVSSVVLN